MALEDMEFQLPGGKIAMIEFDENGVLIDSEQGLTIHEMHFLSSIAFVYLAGEARRITLPLSDVLDSAYKLYTQIHDGGYEGMRTIEEMTDREFSREVLGWEKK